MQLYSNVHVEVFRDIIYIAGLWTGGHADRQSYPDQSRILRGKNWANVYISFLLLSLHLCLPTHYSVDVTVEFDHTQSITNTV